MKTGRYSFPATAEFGKQIPKTRIYSNASVTKRVRNLFVKQVEKIIWEYKLSSKTINIPAGRSVKEIQVLRIILRTEDLSDEILQKIDRAIPSPILFILSFGNMESYTAAFKRPSESDMKKWVISSYFRSNNIESNIEEIDLPIVQNMDNLYHSILKQLIPLSPGRNESVRELVERAEELRSKEQAAAKLELRVKRENQFNRKVELNHELNSLKKEICRLCGS